MVIFSHRYLDSDCINFKSFVFLAVIDPSEHHYTTQTSKFKKGLHNAKQMFLKSVPHAYCILCRLAVKMNFSFLLTQQYLP